MSNSTIPETKTSAVPAGPAAQEALEAEALEALARLFRHSLRDGRVHPLLHPVRRYRQGGAQ